MAKHFVRANEIDTGDCAAFSRTALTPFPESAESRLSRAMRFRLAKAIAHLDTTNSLFVAHPPFFFLIGLKG
jgi:hypothetical protein